MSISLKKRKKMLVEAILAAEQRHGCKYEQDGQPVCVIGQLMDICGIDVKLVPNNKIQSFIYTSIVKPLEIFPPHLISNLQAVWDGRLSIFDEFSDMLITECRANSGSEDDTRMLMLFMVEAWDGT